MPLVRGLGRCVCGPMIGAPTNGAPYLCGSGGKCGPINFIHGAPLMCGSVVLFTMPLNKRCPLIRGLGRDVWSGGAPVTDYYSGPDGAPELTVPLILCGPGGMCGSGMVLTVPRQCGREWY